MFIPLQCETGMYELEQFGIQLRFDYKLLYLQLIQQSLKIKDKLWEIRQLNSGINSTNNG
jgi:hypothetical protein